MPVSATDQEIRSSFVEQAGWCDKLGAGFTASLCRLLGERLDRSTEAGRRALDWPGNPSVSADNLPLRLCGGIQSLVRGGSYPELAACYPPNPAVDADRLWRALEPALADPSLAAWLDRAPQTNEVGRSAVLFAGLLATAELFPQPMALLELGASAGLNLLLDRYRYDLGGVEAGEPTSLLRLVPRWEGASPPRSRVDVVARRGVDLAPLDPVRDGERLMAYVWADQPERQAKLAAALAIAALDPPPLDQGDAADWLDLQLSRAPRKGVTRMVLHSVAFHYFSEATQARITERMAEDGASATAEAPLAWLRYEQEPGDAHFCLRLRAWPDGEDRRLAECDPHGRRIRWL